MSYQFPSPTPTPQAEPGVVWTVASGDLRPAANVTCWPTQAQLESDVTAAVTSLGWRVQRGHEFDETAGHGFIDSQRAGIEVFKQHPAGCPADRRRGRLAVLATTCSPACAAHQRPDPDRGQLVAASSRVWSALLNLAGVADQGRGRLLRAVVRRTSPTSWSRAAACRRGRQTARSTTTPVHVPRPRSQMPASDEVRLDRPRLAAELRADKAIIGVFDEGCMGMYNAIIPDELAQPDRACTRSDSASRRSATPR